MRRDGRTGSLSEAGEDVDNTGREASFLGELGGVESTERSLLGALENDNVSASQGWTNFPCPHEEGEVPWDDLTADANLTQGLASDGLEREWEMCRLLLGVVKRLRVCVNDLALDLVCPAAIISQTASRHADIHLGHTKGLAIVEGFDGSERIEMLLEQICQVDEPSSALLGCDVSVFAFKGLTGDGHCMVDIFFCGFVYGYNWLLGGGVDGFKCFAVHAFDEFTVDESSGTRSVSAG